MIEDGRHPVIETMNLGERFVPNDVHMDTEARQILIITGPNMAGKSTFMRQVALLVLMAQMGCMVPAKKARIGIVDHLQLRRLFAQAGLQWGAGYGEALQPGPGRLANTPGLGPAPGRGRQRECDLCRDPGQNQR